MIVNTTGGNGTTNKFRTILESPTPSRAAPGLEREPYARVNTRMTTQERSRARTQWLGYGACALAGCLWDTGFYLGRLAMNEMSVEYIGAVTTASCLRA